MPFFTTTKSNKNTAASITTRSATPTTKSKSTTATTTNPNPMVTDAKPTTPVEVKDVREFEHGRQKAKKSARTQSWRDEEAQQRRIRSGEQPPAPPQLTTTAKRARSGFQAPKVRPDMEVEWSTLDTEEEFIMEWVDREREESEAAKGMIKRSESGKLEVDLTNLMKPAKPRKTKRGMSHLSSHPSSLSTHARHRRIADGDFEVLPSVRRVVALDDRLDGELEADEPWEHLSMDGEDEKVFSYAEIAAIAN